MTAAELRSLAAEMADALEEAVTATLPLLPLSGTWGSGYSVSREIQPTLVATPEEWAEAAHAIASAHALLARLEALT